MSQFPETEFSRPVSLSGLGSTETIQEIAAEAEERDSLVQRFELLSLDYLEGVLKLKKVRAGRGLHVNGTVRAGVVQQCVVSLEPVEVKIEEEFSLDFDLLSPDEQEVTQELLEEEVTVDPEEDREPLNGQMLDLGELLTQQMAIALPSFPRKPEAELERSQWGSEAVEEEFSEKVSPFSKLKELKKNR
ncbi:YceD family protein [Fodinicurvata halophila]|uniref:YceD family protein n=1 Tax=Fodinicurvata halophila TaxID=1419723 RepID=A0ABV8UKQ7_9PROT